MIKTVTPEAVNVKEKKTGTTNGRDWTLWPVGVAVKGTWYNGAVFNQDDLDYIQKDKPCVLDFYQEEYRGEMQWKFKLPNKQARLEDRISALEERVKVLEQDNPSSMANDVDLHDDSLPF